MRVLFATSELAPLIKTGGLADVSASLPRALRNLGVDCRVLVPGYPSIIEGLDQLRPLAAVDWGAQRLQARLMLGDLNGLPVYAISCPSLFERNGSPYQSGYNQDWQDNPQRFALLSRVAALLASDERPIGWRPDILHCNDWQTGLAPAYLNFGGAGHAAVMLAIHNLAYQGNFESALVTELGLPAESFDMNGVEFHGRLSFLKAGLYYADHIVTVSPTYACEVQTEAFGHGLQGLLRSRQSRLTGILNGIDEIVWDPATDPLIVRRYDRDRLAEKAVNKAHLQERMGLCIEPGVPLFGIVSRLAHQKGIDLVLDIAPDLLSHPAQLVVLGAGDSALERGLSKLAASSDRMAISIGFDEALAHQIEAGADYFLMPSRYEPCGLNQMYSQRYGTPPIAHATGGLADSIVDIRHARVEDASGFLFYSFGQNDFFAAIMAACVAYSDTARYAALQQNGMSRDFGWNASARRYLSLFDRLLQARGALRG